MPILFIFKLPQCYVLPIQLLGCHSYSKRLSSCLVVVLLAVVVAVIIVVIVVVFLECQKAVTSNALDRWLQIA